VDENERNLLEALRRAAREEEPAADPRWSALAAGTISEEKQVELLAAAEGSEEARQRYEAFRPLDVGVRARMTERVLAELNLLREDRGSEGADRRGDPAPPTALRGGRAQAPKPPASAWRRRRTQAGLLVAAILACAAAFSLVVLVNDDGRRDLANVGDPPRQILAYALSVEGGERVDRSPGDFDDLAWDLGPASPSGDGGGRADRSQAIRRLGPRSRLAITLRPERDVEGPVAARAFLVREGRAQKWEPPMQIAKSGSILIEGVKESLFAGVPPGVWDAVFVVGRPDALPGDAEILLRAAKPDASPGEPSDGLFGVLRLRVLLSDEERKDGP
jgi:hypothetical protein